MGKVKIKISNMYGLNECADFDLTANKRNTLIYGYNAVGKSSVAKSFGNIISKSEYKPRLVEDSETFSFDLKFDDLDIHYDEKTAIESLPDIRKKVYVYDKNYAKNNIYSDNNTNELPEIGIRINEKKNVVETKNRRLDEYKKVIKKGISIIGTAQGNFKKDCVLSRALKSSEAEKNMESIISQMKNLAFNLDTTSFSKDDFIADNLNIYTSFKTLISSISKELIEEIKQYVIEEDYKIETLGDLTFYERVIEYFTSKDTMTKCPICLNDKFNYDEVRAKIKKIIDDYLSKEKIDELNKFYKENIENANIQSIIFDNIKEVIENIFNGIYLAEKIELTSNLIDNLYQNYDELLFVFAGLKREELLKENEELEKSNTIISEIDDLNKELNNGNFIETFKDMLDIMFSKEQFHVEAELDGVGIRLNIGLKNKTPQEFHTIFDSILSESQKAKISLAFFFAIVIFQHESTSSKILCIFDDPVDSYDSLNKYELSRIIYEFTNNQNAFKGYLYDCYPLIFTHSIEYLRLFKENFYEKKELYVFTKNGLSLLDDNKLFIFQGDYKVLTELVKRNKINLDEMISISPILRELACHSAKVLNNNGDVKASVIDLLNQKLSNDLIHGLFRKNLTLDEFVQLINNYINITINCGSYSNDYLKVIIKNIIDSHRGQVLDFYEEVVLKNIIAIYVRAMFDEVLIKIIKRVYLTTWDYDSIHHKYKMLNDKLKVSTLEGDYSDLACFIRSYISMFNDFGHSANNYLTPLIDVRIERLYEIYDDFYNLIIDDGTVVSSYL